MLHRPMAILLIALLAAQSLLGLTRGGAVLCLGSGAEVATEPGSCVSACEHDAGEALPFRVVSPDPDGGCDAEGCGCVDIEVETPGLFSPLPTATQGLPGGSLLNPVLLADGLVLADLGDLVAFACRWGDDPGLTFGSNDAEASRRTTRLLI